MSNVYRVTLTTSAQGLDVDSLADAMERAIGDAVRYHFSSEGLSPYAPYPSDMGSWPDLRELSEELIETASEDFHDTETVVDFTVREWQVLVGLWAFAGLPHPQHWLSAVEASTVLHRSRELLNALADPLLVGPVRAAQRAVLAKLKTLHDALPVSGTPSGPAEWDTIKVSVHAPCT
jgi:hypothetical protein